MFLKDAGMCALTHIHIKEKIAIKMASSIIYESQESQLVMCQLSSHLWIIGIQHLLLVNKPDRQSRHLTNCLVSALFFTDILIYTIILTWRPLPKTAGYLGCQNPGIWIDAEFLGPFPGFRLDRLGMHSSLQGCSLASSSGCQNFYDKTSFCSQN